ncbi:hypothetical protein FRC16_010692 [Serendipita sp. 398]|nr:hypothetical protein FRC16_010692 [Serendipita sp. 398]
MLTITLLLQVHKAFDTSSLDMSSSAQASESRVQICDICGQSLASSSHLARHKSSVHQGTYLPCPVSGCDFATTRQDSLNNHLQRTHGITPQKQETKFVAYTPR